MDDKAHLHHALQYACHSTLRDVNLAYIKFVIIKGLIKNHGLNTLDPYVILSRNLYMVSTCHIIAFKISCGTFILVKVTVYPPPGYAGHNIYRK